MATATKPIMPSSKTANLRPDPKTPGRWLYDVRLTRQDGSVFRSAGTAKSENEARHRRDVAYQTFNADQGKARDEKKQKRREHTETLATWADYCINTLLVGVKAATTRDAYWYNLNKYVLPILGTKSLEEIRTADLQGIVDRLYAEGKDSAASQLRSATATIFEYAVKGEKLGRNPAKGVTVKSARHLEGDDETGQELRRKLTQEEIELLLTTADGSCMYMPILLGAKFGLRIGECAGLKWQNVDLEKMVLRVSHQRQWTRGGMVLIKTKSKRSRNIPIPPSVAPLLAEAKARAEAEGVDWVCVKNGMPFEHKKASEYMRAIVEKAGLDDPQPTHHSLRGSYLTYLANELGAKPHDLMRLAGHSDVNTTLKYYVASNDEQLQRLVINL